MSTTEENKSVVLRNYAEMNKGNLGVIDELYSEDYVGHIPGMPGPVVGREMLKQVMAPYFQAFPDMQETPEELIAEGDRVVIRETYRATHQGDFMGIPATGKPVVISSIDIYRIVNGKIVEQWIQTDMLGIMQQIGAIPAPSTV